MIMPDSTRFTGGTDAIELEFVERVFQAEWPVKLAIVLHLSGRSLPNTVSLHDTLGSVDEDPPFISGCRQPISSYDAGAIRQRSPSTKP